MKVDYKDPANWIPREIYQLYLGERAQGPLAYYDKAVVKKNLMVFSFDLFALLLFPVWLIYRGQWLLWGVFTGLTVVISVALELAQIKIPASGFAGTFIAMGMMANGFLLTNANGIYLKLKKQGFDEAEIKLRLKNKGAASKMRGSIAFTVYLALSALGIYYARLS